MPECACLEISELFPWFVYAYARFRTWPVKNVKHRQLLAPQISGFSRTSHANPGNIYIHGKLLTRRIHLRRWNRGLSRFWDSKAVLSGFQYCFDIVLPISPSFLHRFHSFFLPFVWAVVYFYFVAVSGTIIRNFANILI